MQKILVVALSASLLVPSAVLAGNGVVLAPGKPAGVRAAQTDSSTVWVAVGAVGLLAGIAAAASNCCQQSNTPVPVATPSTTVRDRERSAISGSDLFHETGRIVFKRGYANRRINVTLLYGRRRAKEWSALRLKAFGKTVPVVSLEL